MDNDIKIFGDKNFSDLSQEIYENNKLKKTQIDLLIQESNGYIQGIEDIGIVCYYQGTNGCWYQE